MPDRLHDFYLKEELANTTGIDLSSTSNVRQATDTVASGTSSKTVTIPGGGWGDTDYEVAVFLGAGDGEGCFVDSLTATTVDVNFEANVTADQDVLVRFMHNA